LVVVVALSLTPLSILSLQEAGQEVVVRLEAVVEQEVFLQAQI
tara:strand:- start:885 stop:1013 length:129 start_codon:yes stop_codon:yes gene_type:complete